jgi:hypothetical protein
LEEAALAAADSVVLEAVALVEVVPAVSGNKNDETFCTHSVGDHSRATT